MDRARNRLARHFIDYYQNKAMEKLATQSVLLQRDGRQEEYQLHEKDYGDEVVFDVSRKDKYLMTIAKDGSILFMNFDAADEDKKIFKLSYLHQLVDAIKDQS